ncbi:glycoside hydrolase family 65 protein [Furfurilactobacillus curtus]|uniref:Kojibiose phosphorylase n=1 Tax=Furfurilactobacillus curtus TaxID=1746200 RepID=A0ABQ5JL18_9LACO
MRTFSVRVLDDAFEISYVPNGKTNFTKTITIVCDPDVPIGENLEKIREKLAGIDFDAAIIENPLDYDFSDTVIGVNHQRIDMGLALSNMLNIPVVSHETADREGLETAVENKRTYNEWHLDYYGEYAAKRNYGQEAMLTIGNGYFGLRGAYLAANADQDNYPGLYVAGLYNQLTTDIAGRDVINEDLVNLPNAQYLSFSLDQQEPFTIKHENISDIYRSLDLHTGVLTTTMLVSLPTGHLLKICEQRVADMHQWHRFVLHYEVTPMNFEGPITIFSRIDGSVVNANVDRYKAFKSRHFDITETTINGQDATLGGQTKASKVNFVIGTRLTSQELTADSPANESVTDDILEQSFTFKAQTGTTYVIEKTIAINTSLETDGNLNDAVTSELAQTSFNDVVTANQRFWERVWHDSDIQIDGDLTAQKLTRVNIYHLFVSASPNSNPHLDASVGARGLHGEAYRGHVFWDELFVLPFYTLHTPDLTKQLLLYRYHRLAAAKKNAQLEGYEGAMYPWQSAQYGDEQSQFVHFNPDSGKFDPDNSRLQRHVSLAVAYNIWLYFHSTNDLDFLKTYGLEMLFEIAHFWSSKAVKNEATGRFDIKNVMGPDEFHENYPNADEPGLTNNAYTNIMVSWLFTTLMDLKKQVDQKTWTALTKKTGLTSTDFTRFDEIAHQLSLDINKDGIIGQFEGYFKLPTLDFEKYRKKYGNISRIDRLLKAEDKSPDSYQVAKQADALMAYYNLSFNTIDNILKQLDYQLPKGALTRNIEYYLARTTHGSTLSRIVYSVLSLITGNMDQSFAFFNTALRSDYYDIQGGTTAEGIHLGVMGAVLLLEMRNYGGVTEFDDVLSITPHLPERWHRLAFREQFKGINYSFSFTHAEMTITADKEATVKVFGNTQHLKAQQPLTIKNTEAS